MPMLTEPPYPFIVVGWDIPDAHTRIVSGMPFFEEFGSQIHHPLITSLYQIPASGTFFSSGSIPNRGQPPMAILTKPPDFSGGT